MPGDIAQRVLRTIQRYRMFVAGDAVGVAVSGGADLRWGCCGCWWGFAPSWGFAWRCFTSITSCAAPNPMRTEQRFVASLAAEYGLEFFVERGDVAAVARERGWNLEDVGRRPRHDFFPLRWNGFAWRVVPWRTPPTIRRKTVLARLISGGTGPAGLAAIYPVNARYAPLLEIRRGEKVREYLAAMGQEWREDLSNQDETQVTVTRGCAVRNCRDRAELHAGNRAAPLPAGAVVAGGRGILDAPWCASGLRRWVRRGSAAWDSQRRSAGAADVARGVRRSFCWRQRGAWCAACWKRCAGMAASLLRNMWSRCCSLPGPMPAGTARSYPAPWWSAALSGSGFLRRANVSGGEPGRRGTPLARGVQLGAAGDVTLLGCRSGNWNALPSESV